MSERLNLDTLVSSALHSHLYLKVDGTEASNAKYVNNIERRNGVYTSPRNIRKIFIKETGIDIVYYRPIAGKGGNLSETINYSEENKKLLQAAYEDFLNQFRGNIRTREINVSGTGLAALVKDFSLSNLEELYFDWTLLLGNRSLFNYFMQINNRLKDYAIQGLGIKLHEFCVETNSTKVQKFSIMQADKIDLTDKRKLSTLLINHMDESVDCLFSNFPRLKYIGFIGNSKEVLRSEGTVQKKNLATYEFHAFYNQYQPGEVKQKLCKGDKFRFCIFADTGINLFKVPFRVDSALYKFDADYLYDYLKTAVCSKGMTKEAELTRWFTGEGSTQLGLESKLGWLEQFRAGELVGQREARKSLECLDEESKASVILGIKKEIKSKNELERTLMCIKDKSELMFILKCLVKEYKKDELVKLFSNFSKAGQEYYTNLLRTMEE